MTAQALSGNYQQPGGRHRAGTREVNEVQVVNSLGAEHCRKQKREALEETGKHKSLCPSTSHTLGGIDRDLVYFKLTKPLEPCHPRVAASHMYCLH